MTHVPGFPPVGDGDGDGDGSGEGGDDGEADGTGADGGWLGAGDAVRPGTGAVRCG
jgi:hypothetical protein